MKDFFGFIFINKKLMGFGFLFNFFSSFGQTFFLSLLVPIWLETFSINNTRFGSIYTLITLLSALGLTITGKYIDKVTLKNYALIVFSGLILAMLFLSQTRSIWPFVLALFMLRFFGQSLMTHTATTGIAKYFGKTRGKALGITSLGHPAGQFVFPLLLIPMLSSFGWRSTLIYLSGFAAILVIPSLLTVNKIKGLKPDLITIEKNVKINYLKKSEFWLIAINSFIIPFLCTSIFIYQYIIFVRKGWEPAWISFAFTFYASFGAISLLISGYLIDRFRAINLFAIYLFPALAAFILIMLSDALWVAPFFYALIGFSTGLGSTIKTSVSAEIFGTKNLGKIKSYLSAIMVISTALSPPLFGWLLDHNFSDNVIFGGSAFLLMLVGLLSLKLKSINTR